MRTKNTLNFSLNLSPREDLAELWDRFSQKLDYRNFSNFHKSCVIYLATFSRNRFSKKVLWDSQFEENQRAILGKIWTFFRWKTPVVFHSSIYWKIQKPTILGSIETNTWNSSNSKLDNFEGSYSSGHGVPIVDIPISWDLEVASTSG